MHYQEFSSLHQRLAFKGDPFGAGAENKVSEWAEMLITDTAKPLAYYDQPFLAKYPANQAQFIWQRLTDVRGDSVER